MVVFKRIAAALAAALIALPAAAHATVSGVTPLVSTQWLEDNIGNENLLVLDIRSEMAKSGKDDYLKGHIPGALWSPYPGFWRTSRDGVVGVVPSISTLEAELSNLGVDEDKTVVIVPAGTSHTEFGAAARIYWTFKYLGHESVAILDGGHKAWVAEERTLEAGNVQPQSALFVAEPNQDLIISTDEVAGRINTSTILIDGRPEEQFLGAKKHDKATRFGHIPGAQHLDNASFYDAQANRLKPLSEIAALLPANLRETEEDIVSYCNTGHWAATNWFVLREVLGKDNVTLYDDSIVGWSQRADLPVAAPQVPAAN
ncbi:sulfurtransferase [Roseibium aquae]|nr:sulfurtransferase [Roseibium aquae]